MTDVVTVGPHNQVVGHYAYAPFGAIVSQMGTRAADNPFCFSSEFHDNALGLVYYNYRHYNQMDGRWCGRDPIEENGGMNLYAMCLNNSMSKTDRVGEDIYLTTGNDRPWDSFLNNRLHQSVCVDVWSQTCPAKKTGTLLPRD